ncbi:MAG: dihydrolipoamide succinyltransferase [Cycloclasticus sp. Phe_18]|jgi:2-oxoglutarate dehydrogenase E2 component (dihydrolipoamide succinyltransferase)|nr:MAG: dihydrolipoamide succinyltransferase [Cycloclasticus sp. Phe_18]MDF1688179.1 2-oxoglutarate dehydrogenase complex dihydrolipoyllysine-residue succinyltransferase [Cycloclasticus sp.]
MSIEVVVPSLPESVADATLVTWHKQAGDTILKDENLVDLETDKVVLEVPALADGVLAEIIEPEGSTVLSGQLLARIEVGSAASTASSTPAPQPASVVAQTTTPSLPAEKNSGSTAALSPAVRKLVADHGLDTQKISASGKGGRITKTDVLNYIKSQPNNGEASLSSSMASSVPSKAAEATPIPTLPTSDRAEQRVPMTRLRAKVAERLIQAQQNTAMLTTFNEVNMQPIMDIRSKYKDKFSKVHDTKLGFMSFFVKAAVESLKLFPAVNASVDEQDIIYHGYYDIGIAVSSPRGLVVPVLRDADLKNFAAIESGIADFGVKARDGKLGLDDLTGGTFTITNGGVFGSMMSTPILNPPQSAILGMHAINQRVMVENGEMVIRPMMYLALSYDHRIIDGKEAVSFLVTIKDFLEDPARLLLNV